MKFDLHIKMDNAAFEDYPLSEVDRILGVVRNALQQKTEYHVDPSLVDHKLYDANGNSVGFYRVVVDEPDTFEKAYKFVTGEDV